MTGSRAMRQTLIPGAVLVAAAWFAGAVAAATVEVRVTGLKPPLGQVGCWLYASPAGFPLESAGTRLQWQAAVPGGVVCRFADVPPGNHAVSVGHDLNGNKRVDVDFIGRPTEQWGVSNNVRPALRSPRFDEASFKVTEGGADLVIEIKLAQ